MISQPCTMLEDGKKMEQGKSIKSTEGGRFST